jgi:hypothetical protein
MSGEQRREVIMSYPIFQTDNKTIIDFKYGIWKNGAYTGQPLKVINCAALNHHSNYSGMTSAIKNILGITDLSDGSDPNNGGKRIKNYCNFHSFPFTKWSRGPVPGMLGAEIGMFFKTIRKPDLNIVTAEWIGLASRTDTPVAHTKTICASTDPVSLDYHTAKYLLYPNSHISEHDPDNKKGPLYFDLQKCSEQSGGILDEQFVQIRSFDLNNKLFQKDDEFVVIGEKEWGYDLKPLLKYFLFRFQLV